MTTPTLNLYPSAPPEKNDLEHRLETNLTEVNSFNNSNTNIEKKITYFIDKSIIQEEVKKIIKL